MSLPSRQLILDRVRTASDRLPKESGGWAELPRKYARCGVLDAEARLKLMTDRLREYDADVVACTPARLPTMIAERLAASGRHVFAAPEGLPSEWLEAGLRTGFAFKIDHTLPTEEIEAVQGVVTAATCGVAESGTIVLHHSSAEGRRVLTLLPDFHLCVLHASQVVETLPEYFDRCHTRPPLVTWISGPSATADIEMTRIKGVHGPRFLAVILVRDEVNPSPEPTQPVQLR
jgi:L-lactate dehydrogenase complex protein LldG